MRGAEDSLRVAQIDVEDLLWARVCLFALGGVHVPMPDRFVVTARNHRLLAPVEFAGVDRVGVADEVDDRAVRLGAE